MKKLEEALKMGESDGKMSEQSAKAKLEIVKELMDEMMALLGGDVKSGLDELKKPVQQVTVAAPNEELLEEGLEKAQELVPKMSDMAMESEDDDMEHMGKMAKMEDEEEDDEPTDLYSMMQNKLKKKKSRQMIG